MNQRDVSMSWEPDALHEECGVFGMYDFDGNDVASSIYYGLICTTAQRTGKLWYCCIRYQWSKKSRPYIKEWDL